MPFNGAGTYSPPAADFPAVASTLIQSTKFNNVINDVATALSTCIAKDGQTTITANLPMAGFKHTGVNSASGSSSRSEYVAAGTVQDSTTKWAGTATGTADAIALALTPAILAYAAGQAFWYKSGASPNTTAMTVAVSGLVAKAIQKNGSALVAGDHPANTWFRITYDGAAFQLEQIAPRSAEVTAYIAAQIAAAQFPAGTAIVFHQTAAPTGWTKDATHNDKALRVVSGTVGSGGATAFTSVFGSGKLTGAHTLTAAETPILAATDHVHQEQYANTSGGPFTTAATVATNSGGGSITTIAGGSVSNAISPTALNTLGASSTTVNAGGGSAHDHTLSLDLQYMDVIVATKN